LNIGDGVCAYIGGGLGNQLFILAAAWEQSKRLTCPLYLDTSHGEKGAWRYALDSLAHPGIVLGEGSPWRSVRLPGNRVIPLPRLRSPLRRPIYVERDLNRFDSGINDIRVGTTLFGYFQSPSYFPSVGEEVRRMVMSAPATPEELATLSAFSSDRRVTVHLRRGDYLSASPDKVLVASPAYAERARALLRAMGQHSPLRVFSDSPELVRKELEGVEGDIQFVDDPALLSPISTIKAMATGEAIIMSNSSFSWWAAWLMQQERGDDALVIAPRPWNESGTAKADMLGPNWIGLDAR
jgi:hypothetical protein